MTEQELIKKLAHTLTDSGWGVSFVEGNGFYTNLAGGDLTVIAQDGTVANLCIVVRSRPEMRHDNENE